MVARNAGKGVREAGRLYGGIGQDRSGTHWRLGRKFSLRPLDANSRENEFFDSLALNATGFGIGFSIENV